MILKHLLNHLLSLFCRSNGQNIKLEGKKVILRPGEEHDVEQMLRWYNDQELNRLAGWGDNHATRENIVYSLSKSFGCDPMNLIIETKAGVAIGLIQLYSIDQFNQSCYLGIRLGERNYWGKGYGSDAILTLVSYAFEELGIHRVMLRVYEYNQRAYQCYVRCGFVQEGVTRQSAKINEQFYDEIIMGILKSDFDQQLYATKIEK